MMSKSNKVHSAFNIIFHEKKHVTWLGRTKNSVGLLKKEKGLLHQNWAWCVKQNIPVCSAQRVKLFSKDVSRAKRLNSVNTTIQLLWNSTCAKQNITMKNRFLWSCHI